MFVLSISSNFAAYAKQEPLENFIYKFCVKEFSKEKAIEKSKFYSPLIKKASKKYDIPETIIASVIWHESNFKPYLVSPAGALGLMQVMPFHFKKNEDWKNPATNIEVGCRILKGYTLRFNGDFHRALTAYCYGPMYVANRGISRSRYSRAVLLHR